MQKLGFGIFLNLNEHRLGNGEKQIAVTNR